MTDDNHDSDHSIHRPFSWSGDELKGLAIGVGALVVWALAIMLFGFAGVIVPALLLVVVVFVLLVIVSRG